MSLQQWYDSLFARIYPPVREFARGAAIGAGIPTSLEEARRGAGTALGFAFGIPAAHDVVRESMQQTGEALTHPLETGRALAESAQRNPAAAAGVLTGMAVPLNRLGPFSKLTSELRLAKETGDVANIARLEAEMSKLKFGEKALTRAVRRAEGRVARERRRVVTDIEGPLGPISTDPELPAHFRTDVEQAMSLPDRTLQHAFRFAEQGPWKETLRKEIARRGQKLDISEEIQFMEEGGPGGLPRRMLRTREDIGSEMLEGLNLQPQAQTSGLSPTYFANQLVEIERRGDLPPIAPGEKVAIMGQRWQKGTRGWQKLDGKPIAKDYDWVFRRYFDQTPPPQYFGGEFVSEGGGLMEHLGLPEPNPIREANIERAVEEVAGAGNMSVAKARTIVAKRIRDRQKAGLATPQEATWLNIHRMGGFQGGKFRWHQ